MLALPFVLFFWPSGNPNTTNTTSLTMTQDFGLAKPLPEAGCLRTRVGTAYYVAPEVLAQAYTEAADVWSSGVIMYIMLCGAPPFNADKDSDILRLVKKGQYSMESGVWRTVSTTAKSLIKACLEMDHKKRITAQDALSHERPGSSSTRTKKSPRESACVCKVVPPGRSRRCTVGLLRPSQSALSPQHRACASWAFGCSAFLTTGGLSAARTASARRRPCC